MKRQPNIQTPLELQETGDILYTTRPSPDGFLPADGSVVSQSAYPELFEAVGLLGGSPGPSSTVNQTSGTSSHLFAVAYGDGKFVTTGYGGALKYSTDRVNWNYPPVLPTSQNINAVVFAEDTFVAVGNNSTIFTSPDGIDWTSRTAPSSGVHLSGITYGDGLFVAIGYTSTVIWTSPNGINWTARTTPASSVYLFGITYANGLFVIVGGNSLVWTSPDGINWTAQTISYSGSLYGVTHGNGLFVAFGTVIPLMTSTDGVNWTLRDQPSSLSSTATVYAMAYSDGMFLAAVDSAGEYIWYSDDGINWNTHPHPSTSISMLNGVGAHDGMFVLVGPDGTLWSLDSQTYPYNRYTQFQLPTVPDSGDATAWIKT